MKLSLAVTYLFLFFFLLHQAKGIRLEKGSLLVDHDNVLHNKEEKSSQIKRIIGRIGEVILRKEGYYTGTSRKLSTMTPSTSISTTTSSGPTLKNVENKGNKVDPMTNGRSTSDGKVGGEQHEKFTINSSPNGEHQEVTHDSFVDIMDYSPARRKPPIHN